MYMWYEGDRLFLLVGGSFAIIYACIGIGAFIKKKYCKDKVLDSDISLPASPTNSISSESSYEEVELYLKPDYSSNESSDDQYYDPNEMNIPDSDK